MTSQFFQESIDRKARHCVRWHPTPQARLDQLAQMADFAGRFPPHGKSTNDNESSKT